MQDTRIYPSFFLRKTKKEHSIVLRIIYLGKMKDVRLGRTIDPQKWDKDKQISKGKSREDNELNEYLSALTSRLWKIHADLQARNEYISRLSGPSSIPKKGARTTPR